MYKQFKLQNMDNNTYAIHERITNEPCCEQAPMHPQYVHPQHEMRDIEITPLNYGFIVKIGCNRFAIETKEKLVEKLSEYIMNPTEKENNWSVKGLI